jgi:uncharacterized protein YecE (DUF72 family)
MCAQKLPDMWFIGTMGFSYADWTDVFYPSDIRSADFLAYYSRIFNAVEIDSSFYGTPRQSSIEKWNASTPDGFQFCLKAPRDISHEAGLVGAEVLMRGFIERVLGLGDKLGAILFQFPPSFRVDQMEPLERVLASLPRHLRFAVEVRHASWHVPAAAGQEPPLAAMLRRYGVAWAATEYPGLPGVVYPTADFVYVRWIGKHGSFDHHDHERIDRTTNLQDWLERLSLQPANTIYGFLNNDYAGFAAGTANKLKTLAGLPVTPFGQPRQPKLF